ncbi:unnamed protein product [Parnassius mnemosyne]|uniref:Zinc finger protein n=1 Tax=Parnassius mnemosyne TaxID=213953 RepID=A0AAV1KK07_9NEOP
MVDLTITCRTCMKSSDNLVDLFGPLKIEDNYNILLADILMITTATQVSRDDGLPRSICSECVNILEMFVIFRNNALKCEEQLKKLVLLQSTLKEELKDDATCVEPTYESIKICSTNSQSPKFETKTEANLYVCDKCKKQYVSHKRFLNHLATHDESSFSRQLDVEVKLEPDFTDSLDDNVSESAILDIETDSRDEYKCNECNQIFYKERSLISHRRKHRNCNLKNDGNPRFECDYCGKDFSMKPLLKRHLKLHSIDRPYICSKCPKRYTRQDQLLEHMKRHNKVKTHICTYCNKGFFQLCSLKDHLRVHTKEAPYLCSECGKSFSSNSNLRQHMNRHTGIKPFACTFCPKTFTTKGQMMGHLTTHTGAHPHKCDECGASFTKLNSLKKHKFIHLDIKAFACDTCNKRFSCNDHLKRHKRIHTGEKPYRCKYCDRAFTQSNDVAKHMRMHVGQNIYQCTECSMKFRLMRDLKKHYPIHYIKGEETPTVPIGKGMVAPVVVLKSAEEPTTAIPEEPISHTDRQITITVNSNGYRDGVAGDIIINVVPQNS